MTLEFPNQREVGVEKIPTKENSFERGNQISEQPLSSKISDTSEEVVFRNLMDEEIFKKERREILESKIDSGESRQKIKALHHERFLQIGAEIFRLVEDLAHGNNSIKGADVALGVEKYFAERKISLSADQRIIINKIADVLDGKRKELEEYLSGLKKRSAHLAEDKVLDGLKSLKDWSDFLNKDGFVKRIILRDLGGRINPAYLCDPGPNSDISHKNISIDLHSNFPAILVKVANRETWANSFGYISGVYFPGQDFSSRAIYVSDYDDMSGERKQEITDHERQHLLYHQFIVMVKNGVLADKFDGREVVLEELDEIERKIGVRFDKNDDRSYSGGRIKDVSDGINADYDKEKTKERKEMEFWNMAQDEACAFLEGEKNIEKRVDSLTDFLYVNEREEIGRNPEFSLVTKESLDRFDRFHDAVVFYVRAGADHQKVREILRTSSGFDMASDRIKKNFKLAETAIRRALEEKFNYRDPTEMVEFIENQGQTKYFLEKLTLENFYCDVLDSMLDKGKSAIFYKQKELDREALVLVEKILAAFENTEILKGGSQSEELRKLHDTLLILSGKEGLNMKNNPEVYLGRRPWHVRNFVERRVQELERLS
jgi:hypothetical protein